MAPIVLLRNALPPSWKRLGNTYLTCTYYYLLNLYYASDVLEKESERLTERDGVEEGDRKGGRKCVCVRERVRALER